MYLKFKVLQRGAFRDSERHAICQRTMNID